jgi:endonuclease/exonuclease/phosphatase family metal-dependent hydrolase
LRNTNSNALCNRVFGIKYDANATPFLNRELTVRIAVSKEKGPAVYLNGQLVSECIDTSKLSLTDAFAVALKVSSKVSGELDNVIIWKGLNEAPSDRTVGYTPTQEESSYKIISLNLLYDSPAARADHMKSFIKAEKPDVVGLQEIGAPFNSILSYWEKPENGAYKIADRYVTGTSTVNMAPILYDSNRFELVEGTLAHGAHLLEARWPGSKSKIISWAILRDRQTGRRILAMNAHFAVYVSTYNGYNSEDAVAWRIENAKYAIALLDSIRNEHGALPTFFTGDFNMQNHEKAHRIILQRLTDSQLYAPDAKNFMASYNSGYSTKKHNDTEKYPIDHIYISSGDWTVKSHRIIRNDTTMVMTDHYPVIAEMTLNKVTAPTCSHVSGTYTGNQSVSLTAYRTNGSEILYTTDGTDPRTNGKIYTAPVSVSGNIKLRAVTRLFGQYSNETEVRFRAESSPELLITSVVQNTPDADLLEGFQIINVSANAVDLADYKVFCETQSSQSALDAIAPASMIKNLQLSNVKGKYVLQPGQTAFIWLIFSDVYTSGNALVTKDADSMPIYDIEKFKSILEERLSKKRYIHSITN